LLIYIAIMRNIIGITKEKETLAETALKIHATGSQN
jgi:hypothetical protein